MVSRGDRVEEPIETACVDISDVTDEDFARIWWFRFPQRQAVATLGHELCVHIAGGLHEVEAESKEREDRSELSAVFGSRSQSSLVGCRVHSRCQPSELHTAKKHVPPQAMHLSQIDSAAVLP